MHEQERVTPVARPHQCRGCGKIVDALKLDAHEKECSNPGKLRQYRERKSAMGKRSAHKRLHVRRGIRKPDCPLCKRELAAINENMRRLEAWAAKEGTRRNVAQSLVNECAKHYEDCGYTEWAFVWEITGDPMELRNLVELLGNRIEVKKPLTQLSA